MAIVLDPVVLRERADHLRNTANDLAWTATELQRALSEIGHSSHAVSGLDAAIGAIRTRATDLVTRASFVENFQPIDLVATAPHWKPTDYENLGAGEDDLTLLIGDLDRRIDNWQGSDNDPILDDLIRTRTELRDQLGTAQGFPTEFQPDVLRLYQLFALSGLTGPEYGAVLEAVAGGEPVPPAYAIDEWLAQTHPELVRTRQEIATELISLLERRGEIGGLIHDPSTPPSTLDYLHDSQYSASERADILRELDDIDRRVAELEAAWDVPPRLIEEFLGPMSDAERDRLLGITLVTKGLIGDMPSGLQAYVDTELIRIRTEWAINIYTGGGPEDPVDEYMDRVVYGDAADFLAPRRTRELGEIINELDPPGQPGALDAFLSGLFLGDIVDSDYQGGSAFAHMVGAIISGELIYGDIRDVIANVGQGDWGNASLAGVGFIPLVGGLRHVDEVAAVLKRVDEAAEGIKGLKKSDVMVRHADISNDGYRIADELIAELGTARFTHNALDNGFPALATVMTKDELADTMVELRRIEGARIDAIDNIDELIETGDLAPDVAAQLTRIKNALDTHLDPDDLVGAIRDANGIPVYEVVDDLGTLRKVEHDREVTDALISYGRGLETTRFPGAAAQGLLQHELNDLWFAVQNVTGITPSV